MEEIIRPKVRLEQRFNVWVYVIALYLSYLAGNFFNNDMAINTALSQVGSLFKSIDGYIPYAFVVVLHILTPMLSVAIFEVFSRVFYYITNSISRQAIGIGANRFTRSCGSWILINLVNGVLNIFYYFFPFLVPLGLNVLSFVIEGAGLLFFFFYLNKHYLDEKTADKAFLAVASFYLIYILLAVVL